MQSTRIFKYQRPIQVCCRQLQLLWLACIFLLCSLPCMDTTSCTWPCDTSICSDIDTSYCSYGTVKDGCDCCDVCAKGPGEMCRGGLNNIFGFCAEGLECVLIPTDGLSPAEIEQRFGFCTVVTATTSSTPATTSTQSTAPSPSTTTQVQTSTRAQTTTPVTTPVTISTQTTEGPIITDSSTITPGTTGGTITTTVTEPPTQLDCEEPCSVDLCVGRATVCSARGLEYRKNPTRNACQHTSCHACFLLVGTDCDEGVQCGEPPTKACLKNFYRCVRRHFVNASPEHKATLFLKLDTAEARDYYSRGLGRVLCYVPSLVS